jgi:hypothetical protein
MLTPDSVTSTGQRPHQRRLVGPTWIDAVARRKRYAVPVWKYVSKAPPSSAELARQKLFGPVEFASGLPSRFLEGWR